MKLNTVKAFKRYIRGRPVRKSAQFERFFHFGLRNAQGFKKVKSIQNPKAALRIGVQMIV